MELMTIRANPVRSRNTGTAMKMRRFERDMCVA